MITVIAGVNGAGKSSVVGSWVRAGGGGYFNPDEVTRSLMDKNQTLTPDDANGQAWQMGFDALSRAIESDSDYTFETTLGGNSICKLLHAALDKGVEVRVLFCGLSSPELHLKRVAARVGKGGHDIPEEKIRQRWSSSIHNLMTLIPRCSAVMVYDNSAEIIDGVLPAPILLFSLSADEFRSHPIANMPEWAKPLAAAAIKRNLGYLRK